MCIVLLSTVSIYFYIFNLILNYYFEVIFGHQVSCIEIKQSSKDDLVCVCASMFVTSPKEDDKKMNAHVVHVVTTGNNNTYSVQKLSCTRRHA
jgi:hypothetical protein